MKAEDKETLAEALCRTGRQQVVDWLIAKGFVSYTPATEDEDAYYTVLEAGWQAQLKKWRLE